MTRSSPRLVIDPKRHDELVLFFDGIKLINGTDSTDRRWEFGGVCFRPGSQVVALEIHDGNLLLPSIATLGLPSSGVALDHPNHPESLTARWRISIDSQFLHRYPCINLSAEFSSGERLLIAVIHLFENAASSVSMPFIAAVHYGKDYLRFFVSDPEDEIQGNHHAKGLLYEAALLEYLRDTCPRGLMVADVGANVGNHAVYFDRVLGAREVFVFEPNEVAREILLKNLALNNCENVNTRYVNLGVSNTQSRYRVGKTPNKNLGGTPLIADDNGAIATGRLDDLLRCLRVGLIKIDVEGMELSVLQSAERLIARSAPVIAVEVTPASVSEVQSFLDSHSYRVERTFSMYADCATLIAVPTRIFPPQ